MSAVNPWVVVGPGDDPSGWTECRAATDKRAAVRLAVEMTVTRRELFHAYELEPPGGGWERTTSGAYVRRHPVK